MSFRKDQTPQKRKINAHAAVVNSGKTLRVAVLQACLELELFPLASSRSPPPASRKRDGRKKKNFSCQTPSNHERDEAMPPKTSPARKGRDAELQNHRTPSSLWKLNAESQRGKYPVERTIFRAKESSARN